MVRRNPSYAVPDYQTTSTEVFKPAGNQFKRKHPGKHEERLVGRLETVTTVHEDLILCEAVIVFEAYAPPAIASALAYLACLRVWTLVIPSLKTFHGHASDGWKNDPERRNENEKHADVMLEVVISFPTYVTS